MAFAYTKLMQAMSAVGAAANYIEDVFSTYLYTGDGSGFSVNNGIDLAGKGGLTWIKQRNAAVSHLLYDTSRGATNGISSNNTNAQSANANSLTAFNSNGFSLGTSSEVNGNSNTYVSWTFREQAKFFDVVTYTGNSTARTIAHSLGSVPGCIMVKRTDAAGEWNVWHRSLQSSATNLIRLNRTDADFITVNGTGTTVWDSTNPTSTVFSLGTSAATNGNGATYVAYLFAHDAGGFGPTGTDNVITCGSYTGNGSATGPTVTLGYEPQWLLIKKSNAAGENWMLVDNMRGFVVGGNDARLYPNDNGAETSATRVSPTATGFQINSVDDQVNTNGGTYIYIAIRRGPMKTPTSGTSVFSPVARTGTGAIANVTCGFAPDMVGMAEYPAAIQTGEKGFTDKLRGGTQIVYSSNTTGELAAGDITQFQNNGVTLRALGGDYNVLNALYINWFFQRAPSFFDIVCYTGTGSNTTFTHNLGVVPEIMFVKRRSATNAWAVYANNDNTDYLVFNTDAATVDDNTYWNDTSPTSSVFSVGTNNAVNASGSTYVAYLFATCAGVSKVGSYTGTGATQVVNCGFAAGSRFVLIKATSTTGDWYVWDSARGIVAGNDPYLAINTGNAEVTNTDWVDTAATGFELSNAGGNLANSNGVSYVFLAIA